MDFNTPLPSDSDGQMNPTEDHPETQSVDTELLLQLLETAQRNLDTIKQMLSSAGVVPVSRTRPRPVPSVNVTDTEGARIIEGLFDGQNMVGPDGKQYSVPANYASKSKLVEGDLLKLTITKDGSFIYKQIGPIERQRRVGTLTKDETTGEYKVTADGATFKVLLASVTYFKGDDGDEVVILVPKEGESRWAAVENVIKPGDLTSTSGLL